MVSRKEEKLDFDAFVVGKTYTRAEIAELGDVEPLQSSREWTGIVEFENSIVLFSTLQKEDLPPEHNYADVFSDGSFLWESQNRNTQTTPVILRVISLEAPVLFFLFSLRCSDSRRLSLLLLPMTTEIRLFVPNACTRASAYHPKADLELDSY